MSAPPLLLGQLAKHAALSHRVFLKISLCDPHCPEFCNAVERLGYRFCGILPPRSTEHYVVYSLFKDEEINPLALYSEQAKALRSYLLQSSRH